MKVAIITITEDAQRIAFKLKDHLEKDPTIFDVKIFNRQVREALKTTFKECDCIICIMAVGIVIRNICSLIENKMKDPAIIAIDDAGEHVISLLSGHFGGANEITLKIAGILGSKPVITTATDIHGKLGIDSLARKYYLDIADPKKIMTINTALINDKKPDLCVSPKFEFIFKDMLVRDSYNLFKSKDDNLKVSFEDTETILKPKKLVVGVGARKGISQVNVQDAIKKAIQVLDLSPKRIDAIATGEMKKDESGIIETALTLDVPLEIVSLDKLKNYDGMITSSSPFVLERFGIPGVSEPSALLAAGNKSRLIFKKTVFNGVTIAIAVSPG